VIPAELIKSTTLSAVLEFQLNSKTEGQDGQDTPDRLTVFIIPVGKWSDGDTAPAEAHWLFSESSTRAARIQALHRQVINQSEPILDVTVREIRLILEDFSTLFQKPDLSFFRKNYIRFGPRGRCIDKTESYKRLTQRKCFRQMGMTHTISVKTSGRTRYWVTIKEGPAKTLHEVTVLAFRARPADQKQSSRV